MGNIDGTVGACTPIHSGLVDGRHYNIVIVAEGYTADPAQRAQFKADALAVVNKITATPPFDKLSSALNIYMLEVDSTEAGADTAKNSVATYFDACFSATTPELLLVDAKLVANTVRTALPNACVHKIIVLVNTPVRGGSGGVNGGVAVASRALDASTMLHELGHLFGLFDEYDRSGYLNLLVKGTKYAARAARQGAVGAPNLSSSADWDKLPWKDLVPKTATLPTVGHVPDTTVGAFAVDDNGNDDYRPMWECRMRDADHGLFCKVCCRHIKNILEDKM